MYDHQAIKSNTQLLLKKIDDQSSQIFCDIPLKYCYLHIKDINQEISFADIEISWMG